MNLDMKVSNTYRYTSLKSIDIFTEIDDVTMGKRSFYPFQKPPLSSIFRHGRKTSLKFLGDEAWPTINVNIHAFNSAILTLEC